MNDAIDDFLEEVERGSARDRYGRRFSDDADRELHWSLGGHVSEEFGAMSLREVRRRDVEALVYELADAGVGRRRLRAIAKSVRALFDYATERGLVETEPGGADRPPGRGRRRAADRGLRQPAAQATQLGRLATGRRQPRSGADALVPGDLARSASRHPRLPSARPLPDRAVAVSARADIPLRAIAGGREEVTDLQMIRGTRMVLDLVGGKWSVDVLYLLANGTRRYSEVFYEVGEISKKTLTQTLRALERDGLIARQVYAEVPPKVEYSLTPLGWSITGPLMAMYEWAAEHRHGHRGGPPAPRGRAATATRPGRRMSARTVRRIACLLAIGLTVTALAAFVVPESGHASAGAEASAPEAGFIDLGGLFGEEDENEADEDENEADEGGGENARSAAEGESQEGSGASLPLQFLAVAVGTGFLVRQLRRARVRR